MISYQGIVEKRPANHHNHVHQVNSYKICLHKYTSTHLDIYTFETSYFNKWGKRLGHLYITFYGLLFISPNRRIHILEHHLQNVSTQLHIYTSTHLRLHIVKSTQRSKVKGFHTACILIFIFMDCFSFLKIVGFIFWNTIYKMCPHIYTSTHLRLHISKSKVKGFGTACIRITFYGLLFISPNHRIHILEHHLQNVSTHLHIYTSTHFYTFETSFFKK